MTTRALLLLLMWPLSAEAALPAVVVTAAQDDASIAAAVHARARIAAETPMIVADPADVAAAARPQAISACAGSRPCMKRALGELGGGLALYLRLDGDSVTIEQALVKDGDATDAHTSLATRGAGPLAAVDRHLDAYVVVPLGHPEAAARARARLGLVPPLTVPLAVVPPLMPKAIPQAPMGREFHGNGPPQPLCYGARTDDCPGTP